MAMVTWFSLALVSPAEVPGVNRRRRYHLIAFRILTFWAESLQILKGLSIINFKVDQAFTLNYVFLLPFSYRIITTYDIFSTP